MGFPVWLTDGNKIAQLFRSSTTDENGLNVYTHERKERVGVNKVFLNTEKGINMNIDGLDDPSLIETVYGNGVSTNWTGSAISGSWNFADTFTGTGGNWPIVGTLSIDCRQANNNNQARLEYDTTLDMDLYDFISGAVYVDSWSTGGQVKEFTIELRDSTDTIIGNSVNLSAYINIGTFDVPQTFKIALSDFGVSNEDLKSIVFTNLDQGGGPAPNILLDDIQISDGGAGYVYTVATDGQNDLWLDRIKVRIEAPYNVTTSCQHAVSMEGILGLTLGNGIQAGLSKNGQFVTGGSIVIRDLRDWLNSAYSTHFVSYGDGTNTAIEFGVSFEDIGGLRLEHKLEEEFSYRIQDDLSTLTHFQVWISGHELIDS